MSRNRILHLEWFGPKAVLDRARLGTMGDEYDSAMLRILATSENFRLRYDAVKPNIPRLEIR